MVSGLLSRSDRFVSTVPVTVTVCLAAMAMTAVALNKKKRA